MLPGSCPKTVRRHVETRRVQSAVRSARAGAFSTLSTGLLLVLDSFIRGSSGNNRLSKGDERVAHVWRSRPSGYVLGCERLTRPLRKRAVLLRGGRERRNENGRDSVLGDR